MNNDTVVSNQQTSTAPAYVIVLIVLSIIVIVGGISIAMYYIARKRKQKYLSYWPNVRIKKNPISVKNYDNNESLRSITNANNDLVLREPIVSFMRAPEQIVAISNQGHINPVAYQ